jgi:phosphatidate phosphatase PAH1
VYITARGSQYTEDTRAWLAARGFPKGPVRLSPSFITIGSSDTIDYKTTMLTELPLPLAAGVGNRATDITAYTNAGIAADSIFIKLPEFSDELAAPLAQGDAIGVDDYATLFH